MVTLSWIDLVIHLLIDPKGRLYAIYSESPSAYKTFINQVSQATHLLNQPQLFNIPLSSRSSISAPKRYSVPIINGSCRPSPRCQDGNLLQHWTSITNPDRMHWCVHIPYLGHASRFDRLLRNVNNIYFSVTRHRLPTDQAHFDDNLQLEMQNNKHT